MNVKGLGVGTPVVQASHKTGRGAAGNTVGWASRRSLRARQQQLILPGGRELCAVGTRRRGSAQRRQSSSSTGVETKPAAPADDCAGESSLDGVVIDRDDPRTAILEASKTASIAIEESGRPLAEYMVLPASQYSVLDAKRIERLDEDTFRCYIGGISLLGFTVDPVITVSVTVGDRGCVVRLLSCQLEGSRLVRSVNSRFNASMTNELDWRIAEDGGKEIVSNMTMEVVLSVPRWFRLVSPAGVSSAGSKVMQQVVNQVVPRFLEQLRTDYALWASGDDSRKPLGDGTIGVDST